MSTKGFTLLECLLVLSVLSLFCIVFPFLRPASSAILQVQMRTMVEKLLMMQSMAMSQKRTISVDFHGNQYTLDSVSAYWNQGITCTDLSFHFTALGSVSHAGSVSCSLHDEKKTIVMELGSGRMYVR